MQRVSKGFFLVAWGGGVGLGVLLLVAGTLLAMDSHMDEAAPFALVLLGRFDGDARNLGVALANGQNA